ncbi:caspase family protein [Rhizobium ruizarguesonis]
MAVIFGASEFPDYPTLDSLPALLASARAFEDYLGSADGLRLPIDNIKSFFNEDLPPGNLVINMRDFVRRCLARNPEISDCIFYYAGHGAYLREREYFLSLKSTNRDAKEATVFKISYLVDVIGALTKNRRNLVILDACYSGGAIGEFAHLSENDAAKVVHDQLFDGLRDAGAVPFEPSDTAKEGTILFCAAGPKKWAKAPLDSNYTMFSGAILRVLKDGDQRGGSHLNLRRFTELVQAEIRSAFGTEGVSPQIHTPVQGDRDLLNLAYFPNAAFSAPEKFLAVEPSVGKIKKNESISPELDTKECKKATNIESLQNLIENNKSPINTSIAIFAINALTYLGGVIVANIWRYHNAEPPGWIQSRAITFFLAAAINVHLLILLLIYALDTVRRSSTKAFLNDTLPRNLSYKVVAGNSILLAALLLIFSLLPRDTVFDFLPNLHPTGALLPDELYVVHEP